MVKGYGAGADVIAAESLRYNESCQRLNINQALTERTIIQKLSAEASFRRSKGPSLTAVSISRIGQTGQEELASFSD
jgi:hypothetical protein